MRLLTHNFLKSTVQRTTKGYPLNIEAEKVVVEESEVNTEMLSKLLPKLNYDAVRQAASQMVSSDLVELPELPERLPDPLDEALIAALHRVLFDVYLIEGHLICPGTERRFPVKDGIPNMILHEDEI